MLREDIERILDAARYLVRLIDMVLDLAKIGAGRMRFDVAEHEIGSIIDDAVEALRNSPEGDQTPVEIKVDPALDTVWVDRCRLLQILDCVLSNAARHARGGQVRIAAGPAGAGGADAFTISIADTGEGIEPEALRTLFETFATERHAADGRYGGTGLKLAVCAQLCRAMGGTITATSVRGAGSTFTISLPLDPEPHATETDASPEPRPVAIAA
jgi:signal transduction histidine kinase